MNNPMEYLGEYGIFFIGANAAIDFKELWMDLKGLQYQFKISEATRSQQTWHKIEFTQKYVLFFGFGKLNNCGWSPKNQNCGRKFELIHQKQKTEFSVRNFPLPIFP